MLRMSRTLCLRVEVITYTFTRCGSSREDRQLAPSLTARGTTRSPTRFLHPSSRNGRLPPWKLMALRMFSLQGALDNRSKLCKSLDFYPATISVCSLSHPVVKAVDLKNGRATVTLRPCVALSFCSRAHPCVRVPLCPRAYPCVHVLIRYGAIQYRGSGTLGYHGADSQSLQSFYFK